MDKKISQDKKDNTEIQKDSPQEEGNDMTTLAIDDKSFKNFINKNKEKIYGTARNNTKFNTQGRATISKDDPWFREDEWDAHFKRPCTPSESLVQSLKEMKLMREGKLPKKSWWDYIKEKKDE